MKLNVDPTSTSEWILRGATKDAGNQIKTWRIKAISLITSLLKADIRAP